MDEKRLGIVCRNWRGRRGVHLDVAESVVGELRGEYVLVAAKRIDVCLESEALVLVKQSGNATHVQPPLGIQFLAMLHAKHGAGPALETQACIARHIGSEVDDIDAVADGAHGFGAVDGVNLHGMHLLGLHSGRWGHDLHATGPMAVIVVGGCNPGQCLAGIIGVARVDIVHQAGAICGAPCLVCRDGLHAVGVGEPQLATQAGASVPVGFFEVPYTQPVYLVVEAVAQHGGDDILAFVEQWSDVIDVVQVATIVVGVTGIQTGRDGTLAVDFHLGVGGGTEVEACFLHFLPGHKDLP